MKQFFLSPPAISVAQIQFFSEYGKTASGQLQQSLSLAPFRATFAKAAAIFFFCQNVASRKGSLPKGSAVFCCYMLASGKFVVSQLPGLLHYCTPRPKLLLHWRIFFSRGKLQILFPPNHSNRSHFPRIPLHQKRLAWSRNIHHHDVRNGEVKGEAAELGSKYHYDGGKVMNKYVFPLNVSPSAIITWRF